MDTFRFLRVVKCQQPFLGAIFGFLVLADPRASHAELFSQRRTQIFRQIRHRLKIRNTLIIYPAKNLLCPIGFHTKRSQRRCQFGAVHPDQAWPCVTQIGIIDEITQPGGISTRSLARSIIHRADPALLFYLTDPVYDVVGFGKSSEGINICGARRTS